MSEFDLNFYYDFFVFSFKSEDIVRRAKALQWISFVNSEIRFAKI